MPGVAGQLVRMLSAPRPLATGTYTVTVSLHPESLGTVQATVTAGESRLSVQLVATTTEAADAIRQGLPELHAALSAGGQRATVTLSGGGGPAGSNGARTGGTPSDPRQHFSNGGAHEQASGASRGISVPGPAVPEVVPASRQPGGDGLSEGRLLDVHV